MDISVKKTAFRRRFLKKSENLLEQYIKSSNLEIYKRLKEIIPKEKVTVFCYVSVKNEVDTLDIIDELLANGYKVCVPKCFGGGLMQAKEITNRNQLAKAAFGLLEPPENAPLVLPQDIGFAVVPCVSASKNGVRLGYGGGYYDRYLQNVNAVCACLCRQALMQCGLPNDDFDKKVDVVISEDGSFWV